jgi:hypothetical protein
MVRMATSRENIKTADELRELIFNELSAKQSPSSAALSYIKNEVQNMW